MQKKTALGATGSTPSTPENQRRAPIIDRIDSVRETHGYKNGGGNERAQMLFDAAAKVYGHGAAVAALLAFSGSPTAGEDFQTFSVGSEIEGFNIGRPAALHFFSSAFFALTGSETLAAIPGYVKEIYDLVGRRLELRGAGRFDKKDLRTNAAGRNFGLHIWQIWRNKGDRTAQLDLSRFTKSSY